MPPSEAERSEFWSTLGRILRIAVRSWKTALPFSLIWGAPMGAVAVMVAGLGAQFEGGLSQIGLLTFERLTSGAVVAILLGLIALTLAATVYPLVRAALAWTGSRVASGRPVPAFDDVVRQLSQQGPSAIGAIVLVALAMAAPAVVVLPLVILALAAAPLAGALALMASLIGFAVWTVVLGTRLSLSSAVVMSEDAGAARSLARSSELVQGRFWFVLGLLLLTALMTSVADAVLTNAPWPVAAVTVVAAIAVSVWMHGIAAGVIYAGSSREDEPPPTGDDGPLATE